LESADRMTGLPFAFSSLGIIFFGEMSGTERLVELQALPWASVD
jgi:hypothetical protein